jgi:hypothetical protein
MRIESRQMLIGPAQRCESLLASLSGSARPATCLPIDASVSATSAPAFLAKSPSQTALADIFIAMQPKLLSQPGHCGRVDAGPMGLFAHRQRRDIARSVEQVSGSRFKLCGHDGKPSDDPINKRAAVHSGHSGGFARSMQQLWQSVSRGLN